MSKPGYDSATSLSSFVRQFSSMLERIRKLKEKENIQPDDTDSKKYGYELHPEKNEARPGPDKQWRQCTR